MIPPPLPGDRKGSPLLGTMEPVTWSRVGQACGLDGLVPLTLLGGSLASPWRMFCFPGLTSVDPQ
jgi:hypothetical protein